MKSLKKLTAPPSLSSSIKERIAHIRRDCIIGFTQFRNAVLAMNTIHTQQRRPRMNCLLIHSDNGMGKTSAANEFISSLGLETDDNGFVIPVDGRCPVVFMSISGLVGDLNFYSELIRATTGGVTMSHKNAADSAPGILKKAGVRTLIIDEFQDIKVYNLAVQRKIFSNIKKIANEMRVAVICLSVYDLKTTFNTDLHMMSRFKTYTMRGWSESIDLRRFILALVARIPLARGHNVSNSLFVQTLVRESEGMTKGIVEMIQGAALYAVLTGHECLDKEMLDKYLMDPFPEGGDVDAD